ncbi:MAG: SPOR domain-containing protein [Alphaproteobacteria bacterium]
MTRLAHSYGGESSSAKYEILRPWRFAFLVAILLSGLAGAFYFLLKKPTSSQHTLPLIKAAQGPIRIAPPPDQNPSDASHHQVYKHIEKGKLGEDTQVVERLLPPVESPLLTAEAPGEPLAPAPSLDLPQEAAQAGAPQVEASSMPAPATVQPSLPFIPESSAEPADKPQASQTVSIDNLLSRGEKASGRKISLQVGPFSNKAQALKTWQRIQSFKLSGASKEAGVISSLPLGSPRPSKYVIFIRGISSLQDAQRLVAQLHQKKVSAIVLKP